MSAADVTTLPGLAQAEERCTRCPLYRGATRAVPGEGPASAPVMLVGEQPGDREDMAGRPFVGPAGQLLDRALAAADIARDRVFVTNAVKHFKYEWRGKHRLHKRPSASEIDQCRWWLDVERHIVRPKVIVGLGSTSLRGIIGRTVTIASLRGIPQTLGDGTRLLATIHPSAILRTRDADGRKAMFDGLVSDLASAVRQAAIAPSRRPAD